MISTDCLGTWVVQDLVKLRQVFTQIANMEVLKITYEDALEAAKDAVTLVFKNREYCEVERVV